MGWGRYFLLGDLGQQLDLQDQKQELERLRRRLHAYETAKDSVSRLQEENGELKLYVAVLFRLLVSKGIATDQEIRSLIEIIDASDGQVDQAFDGDVVTGKPETTAKAAREKSPFADLE